MKRKRCGSIVSIKSRQGPLPCLAGTGLPVRMLVSRFLAGESVDLLADDYGVVRSDIELCLRYSMAKIDDPHEPYP